LFAFDLFSINFLENRYLESNPKTSNDYSEKYGALYVLALMAGKLKSQKVLLFFLQKSFQ
jgi:hypothetical protein